jgi:hypothetical protein
MEAGASNGFEVKRKRKLQELAREGSMEAR